MSRVLFETPKFAGEKLRWLASGWRLAPLYRIQSGSPLSVIAGAGVDTARNGTATASQPADQVLPNGYGDTSGRPLTFWINMSGCSAVLTAAPTDASKCAFHQPAIGTLGNMNPGRSWTKVSGRSMWGFLESFASRNDSPSILAWRRTT